MELKQKYKDYLKEKNISNITELAKYIENVKITGNDREMMFNLVWLLINRKDSLLSFFHDEKQDIEKIKNSIIHNNTIPKSIIDIVNILLVENDEDLKKIFKKMTMDPNEIIHHKFSLFMLEKKVYPNMGSAESITQPTLRYVNTFESLKEAKEAQNKLVVKSIIIPTY